MFYRRKKCIHMLPTSTTPRHLLEGILTYQCMSVICPAASIRVAGLEDMLDVCHYSSLRLEDPNNCTAKTHHGHKNSDRHTTHFVDQIQNGETIFSILGVNSDM